GKEMLLRMLPLWSWIITSASYFRETRAKYDGD
ncbi:transcriptional regulator, partial [Escherichia coli]